MHSWMRRRLWIAPLHFDGDTGGSGGDGAGTGSTGSSGAAAGGGSGAAGSGSGATGSGDAGSGQQGEPGPVPYARFREVNEKAQRLEREQEERRQAELKAKGEHETLAKEERAKREAAEAKALKIGRRAAFVSAAASKVADASAAATLAIADGMLDELELDDDGAVTKGDAAKIVDKLLERYPFLAASSGPAPKPPTGKPLSGAGANPVDPEKMSTEERLRHGIEESMKSLPAARQGVGSTR